MNTQSRGEIFPRQSKDVLELLWTSVFRTPQLFILEKEKQVVARKVSHAQRVGNQLQAKNDSTIILNLDQRFL